jgi:hypothetical protein
VVHLIQYLFSRKDGLALLVGLAVSMGLGLFAIVLLAESQMSFSTKRVQEFLAARGQEKVLLLVDRESTHTDLFVYNRGSVPVVISKILKVGGGGNLQVSTPPQGPILLNVFENARIRLEGYVPNTLGVMTETGVVAWES